MRDIRINYFVPKEKLVLSMKPDYKGNSETSKKRGMHKYLKMLCFYEVQKEGK